MSGSQPPSPYTHLLYRGRISTPPDSPQASPQLNPQTTISSSSSVEQLPPAMSGDHRNMPAPSDDHGDMMVSHASDIVLEDEESYEDRTHNNSRGSLWYRPSRSQSNSRSGSPSRGVHGSGVTHPLSNSVSASSSFSSTGLSSVQPASTSAAPSYTFPSSANNGSNSRGGSSSQHHHHQHPHAPNNPLASFFSSHASSSSSSSSSTAPAHTNLQRSSSSSATTSSKTLRIELTSSEVVLVAGMATKMEGTVYVNLHKNIKVKSLLLEFSGRSSVTWIDDNAYSPATRHTTAPHIEHSWALISHQHKQPPTPLQSGQHAFPFSLELPDTLPESLTTTHGKVAYRLTATLTKPGLTFHSSTVTIPVILLRKQPIQTARSYQRGARVVSEPEDKIRYKISLPQVRVPHSTKVPLQVSITTLTPRTTINVLQVGLWERVVYRADGRKRLDMRLVKIQKSEGWPHEDRNGQPTNETITWNKVLLFDMPSMGSELNQCNPSADNGLMKVTHLLRFSILGSDGVKRFRVENEIDVKVLAFEDQFHDLTATGTEDGEEGDLMNELPSYLTSFTTPRVSFDSERDMDPMDDDLLRALVSRIHLPTYAESEEDTNSRNTSRDVSRNVSRAASRNTSPERTTGPDGIATSSPHHHHHHHQSLPPVTEVAVPEAAVLQQPVPSSPGHSSVHAHGHGQGEDRSLPNPYQPHNPTPLRSSGKDDEQ